MLFDVKAVEILYVDHIVHLRVPQAFGVGLHIVADVLRRFAPEHTVFHIVLLSFVVFWFIIPESVVCIFL